MSYNYQDASRESQQEYFGKVHTDNKETLYNALKRIADLEKENAKLKSEKGCETCTKFDKVQLAKATELIEDMYDKISASHSDYYKDVMERARQFLKEIEK